LVVSYLLKRSNSQQGRGDRGRRELARRLKTSVPRLYRLLDTTSTRKSIDQLVSLLQLLDCSVDLVVTEKEADAEPGAGTVLPVAP
jgi:hypothetical protein